MTTTDTRSLDWLRVGAWSGSLAAHISILLLVALPLTVPETRQQATTIVARWIEPEIPPPTFPEPPPPQAPHRVQKTPVHTPPPPTIVASSDASTPTNPIADPVMPPGPPDIAPPNANDIGSGGASQMLAYASPLQPRYPPASMRDHEQGTVMLHVFVDETGVPRRIEIARSSGHTRLDAAARESVSHARFRPVMRNGQAISAWGIVPIEFRIGQG
jgi:periplasmic protein TonB